MAFLSSGRPFGFTGLSAGLRFATGQDNLFDANQQAFASLQRDAEQNVVSQLLGQGNNTLQAAAYVGQNSPFLNQGLSRLGSAIGAQQALAPSAILNGQQGNFGPINQLAGLFGGGGHTFNAQNFGGGVSALPLLGAPGLGANVSIGQQAPFNALALQALQQQLQFNQELNTVGNGTSNGPQNSVPSITNPYGGANNGSVQRLLPGLGY